MTLFRMQTIDGQCFDAVPPVTAAADVISLEHY
jgi:hypothetical protein